MVELRALVVKQTHFLSIEYSQSIWMFKINGANDLYITRGMKACGSSACICSMLSKDLFVFSLNPGGDLCSVRDMSQTVFGMSDSN